MAVTQSKIDVLADCVSEPVKRASQIAQRKQRAENFAK